MVTTAKDADSGEEIELHDLLCSGCGQTMDGHNCPGSSFTVTKGAAPVVSRSGAGMPRGKKTEKPRCPHCNGVAHYNLGGGAEDELCAWRQYLIHTGEMTDPLAAFTKGLKLVPGSDKTILMHIWVRDNAITFGSMPTASGGVGGTWAAITPKPPSKRQPKKGLTETVAEAAPPELDDDDLDTAEIVYDSEPEEEDIDDDIIDDEEEEEEEEAPAPAPVAQPSAAEKRSQASSERRRAAMRQRMTAAK